MKKNRLCTISMISMILAVSFLIYSVSSLLSSTVVISSSGQISSTTVTAISGSPADIQAAVNLVMASGGGTVYLPEGVFTFDVSAKSYDGKTMAVLINMEDFSGDLEIIGNNTVLVQTETPTYASMIFVEGRNGGKIRISGITFEGHVENEDKESKAISLYRCKDFRVDHCSFTDFSEAAVSTFCYTGSPAYYGYNRGVIDHCNIDNPYKDVVGGIWGYGIEVHGAGRDDAWENDMNNLLGQYDSLQWCVYIEDCTFSRTRHAVASNGVGYYVVRYCTFTEPRPQSYGQIDVHGPLSAIGIGGRGLEAYNNVIYAAEGYDYSMALGLRGGGGAIFDNTIIGCRFGVTLSHDVWVEKYSINDIWIWDNTFVNVTVPIYDQYDAYIEDVDYFLYENPTYTPYTYPHPLTLES